MVLCISPEYFDSEQCLIECTVARGYGKTILPIIIGEWEDYSHVVIDKLGQYEATNGLQHVVHFNLYTKRVYGLHIDETAAIDRLIYAILNPTSLDKIYEIYTSYPVRYAQLISNITDDLNSGGISTFSLPQTLNIGDNAQLRSWNVMLKAPFHLIILSPDVADSRYIPSEIAVTRSKDTIFIPVLPEEFSDDDAIKAEIRQKFSASKNLEHLNRIQWFDMKDGYDTFIKELIHEINRKRNG